MSTQYRSLCASTGEQGRHADNDGDRRLPPHRRGSRPRDWHGEIRQPSVIIQSRAEMYAAQAYSKPIISALKQQSHTSHRHRSVSFCKRNNIPFELQNARTPEQSSSEQGCEDLKFTYSTEDAYEGSNGLSTMASIAQVGQQRSHLFLVLQSSLTACQVLLLWERLLGQCWHVKPWPELHR